MVNNFWNVESYTITHPQSLKSGRLDTLWAGEISAQHRLFGALLLIKIHTLWQKDFKAKASQVVCEAQQNLQNCGSVEQDGSLISCKWWHIWAVLAPFLPQNSKEKSEVSSFFVSWSECVPPAAL